MLRPTYRSAFAWSVTIAFTVTLLAMLIAFVTNANIALAGVLEIASSEGESRQATEFMFNPLGPVALALVLSLVIWAPGRLARRRER